MLTEIDILRDISVRLETLAIPFMLTGSMAMRIEDCDFGYLHQWAASLEIATELNALLA